MSRTVIVWTALARLPHWSLATQVRAITLVPPQLFVTKSLKVTVTEPQPSCAVATPVALVVVSAGHSSTRLVGIVRVGGVRSLTVIVWSAFVLFPQASTAVQVRLMIFAAPHVLVTTSL